MAGSLTLFPSPTTLPVRIRPIPRSQYAVCDVIGFTGSNTDATLRTPQISLGTVSSPELSFWYHMFGMGIGSLEVQVKEAGASGPWTTVKTITGQQHSSQGAAWTNEIVSLTAFANDTIFIRFKGGPKQHLHPICRYRY